MKKKILICNIIVAIIILLCTNIYATTGSAITVTKDTKANEEFTVTLSVSDVTGITNFNVAEMYLNIDESVVEPITIESIKSEITGLKVIDINDTGMADYGIFVNSDTSTEDDFKILVNSKDDIRQGQNILTITFKVKSTVKDGTYADAVKLEGKKVADTTGTSVEIPDTKVTIKVAKESETPSGETPSGETPSGTQQPAGTPSGTEQPAGTPSGTEQPAGTTGDGKKIDLNKNGNAADGAAGTKPENKAGNNVGNNGGNKAGNKAGNNAGNNGGNKAGNNAGNNAKDNTLANQGIPPAGAANTMIKIVIVGMMLGFVVYLKYKKYRSI